METNKEMETMRMQMAELKRRFDEQVVVNSKMVKKAMKNKSQWIKRKYTVMIVVCAIMTPYNFILPQKIGFSLLFSVITSIFMAVAGVYTYYNMKIFQGCFDMDISLVEAGERFVKAKKRDGDWLKIGIPFVISWLVWFALEAYRIYPDGILMSGGIAGAVIGLICGTATHMKIRRKYKDIIANIKELTDME